jgi:hypothetical protein
MQATLRGQDSGQAGTPKKERQKKRRHPTMAFNAQKKTLALADIGSNCTELWCKRLTY